MKENDWDVLERMLEEWILAHAHTFELRQSLIPIRDYIWDRTGDGISMRGSR